MIICSLFLFINYSLADTSIEKREFVLYAKLPLVPKISVLNIATTLIENNKNEFDLNFKVKTLDLIKYFNEIDGNGSVKGFKNQNNYYPEQYIYDYTRKGKNKSVVLKYKDGNLVNEYFKPSFDKNKLTPISDKQKNNTIDPATLFLRLLDINKTSRCNDLVKVYDGKRRYNIIFKEVSLVNNIIECSAQQDRIGGYKKDKVDLYTNTDLVKLRYDTASDNEFLEFYAKKGLVEITIKEIIN